MLRFLQSLPSIGRPTPPPAEPETSPARPAPQALSPATRQATGGIVSYAYAARNGLPLRQAVVIAQSGTNRFERHFRDAAGKAELAGLPPGRYHVTIGARGYSPASHQITITAGATTALVDYLSEQPPRPPRVATSGDHDLFH